LLTRPRRLDDKLCKFCVNSKNCSGCVTHHAVPSNGFSSASCAGIHIAAALPCYSETAYCASSLNASHCVAWRHSSKPHIQLYDAYHVPAVTLCHFRHVAEGYGGQPCLLFEGNDPVSQQTHTYSEVLRAVCRLVSAAAFTNDLSSLRVDRSIQPGCLPKYTYGSDVCTAGTMAMLLRLPRMFCSSRADGSQLPPQTHITQSGELAPLGGREAR
jgi:hypothetical protein